MTNRQLLVADALFLLFTGSVQMILEISGHFFAVGRYADQFGNSPYTIGFFEAHGLAALIALMVLIDKSHAHAFWHFFLMLVHILLGGANLLFWNSFVEFNFITPGIVVTIVHIMFVALNARYLQHEKTYQSDDLLQAQRGKQYE